ncbi:hypothetical protein D3C72_1382230 [compost metagenome]
MRAGHDSQTALRTTTTARSVPKIPAGSSSTRTGYSALRYCGCHNGITIHLPDAEAFASRFAHSSGLPSFNW